MSDPKSPEEHAAAAEALLAGTVFGPVEWVASTGSTNEDLLEAARHGAPHGLVRVTDHQTAGRGRRNRRWEDAPGHSLLVSVLLRTEVDLDALGWFSAAVAVAAAETCMEHVGSGVGIKWPNDLVVGPPGRHRKLAGILAQSQIDAHGAAVVVGLGLNIRSDALGPLAAEAVGLDELGDIPHRATLLAEILTRLHSELEVTEPAGDVWARYRELSATIGTPVRALMEDREIEGVAVDVTSKGALVIETSDGPVEIVSGDVVSVRPA